MTRFPQNPIPRAAETKADGCHAIEKIDMGLLKRDVSTTNSVFEKGNQTYTDVEQWPADVRILW